MALYGCLGLAPLVFPAMDAWLGVHMAGFDRLIGLLLAAAMVAVPVSLVMTLHALAVGRRYRDGCRVWFVLPGLIAGLTALGEFVYAVATFRVAGY